MIHSLFKRKIAFMIPVILEKDGAGYYASCPALKGVHVGGDTENSVIKNAEEACSLYLQSMMKHGDAIPLYTICYLDKGRNIDVEVKM
jgi:predicted RNase H-like HicB family nuclease